MTGSAAETGAVGTNKEVQPLKILAVHRYFWPDTAPYATLLKRIVTTWSNAGHRVSVLSSQPSYKKSADFPRLPKRERVDGVWVERMSLPHESSRPVLRLFNSVRLCFGLLWRARVRRYDVIMISTYPPVIGGAVAALAAKLTKARFIYHCMDIHPEVGRISGEFSNRLVFSVLQKIDNWTCRQADPVVVLSEDMQATLRARDYNGDVKIEVLNNFSLPSEQPIPDNLPFAWPENSLTLLFAGNVGRFQGLESVIQAMGILRERNDIDFVVMGEGAAKDHLEKMTLETGARVHFVGHHPVEIAKAAMRKATLGFVSLTPGVYRYAYPSKTMTYLEQGCPLIVAVEQESELANEVVAGGYGYAVPPGEIKVLANLIETLTDSSSEICEMRTKAREKFAADFSETKVLQRWAKLITPEG